MNNPTYCKTYWKRLKVREVDYGFGWQHDDDPSSDTIIGILDRLDAQFEAMQKDLDNYKKLFFEEHKLRVEEHKQYKVLKHILRNVVHSVEYGVNQWQEAWHPDGPTRAQIWIKQAKHILGDKNES